MACQCAKASAAFGAINWYIQFSMETDLRLLWFITWVMIVYQIYKKVSADRQQRMAAVEAPRVQPGVWTSTPPEMKEMVMP